MENYENTSNQHHEQKGASKLQGYKIVCAKLGLTMCVFYICRLLFMWVMSVFSLNVHYADGLGETAYNLINFTLATVFIYILPILFAALIFNSFANYRGKYRELYKKPKRLARALGTFPATYGLGYGTALLTLLVSYLITRYLTGGQTFIEDLIRPPIFEPTTNLVGLFTLVFSLVLLAPIFEEFLARGIMYDALKPYGIGITILITSLLFGLMHGSLYMLFYTTAMGIALGYIRYATNSLFTVTILHAMINAIAAGTLILSTFMEITNEQNRLLNTTYAIYTVAVLVLIVVGVAVFLAKIPAMRKFKIENSWTDIGGWKKTAWFFASIPVIIMMVFAFNEHSRHWLLNLILR